MPKKRRSSTATPVKGRGSSKIESQRCGLCGKRGRLTRTPCCGNWICDDEANYRPFSFARNSCSRNHGRFTLCAFHLNEGHPGLWQECGECRKQFEPELYVYYGTNEYNFAILPDPPAFAPTLCSSCGERIALGEGGYSIRKGKYFCTRCGGLDLRRTQRDFDRAMDAPDDT